MAEAELGAIFEGASKDMGEAAEQATRSMGTFMETTASTADANVDSVLSVEQEAAANFARLGGGDAAHVSESAAGAVRPAGGEVPGAELGGFSQHVRDVLAGHGDGAGARAWPADPSTGSPLTDHDLEFLGLTHEQIHWWRNGEAPLGMTPATYHEWSSSMLDALRQDGIPAQEVDVRMLGSAARGFSGPHKLIPTEQEITDGFPQDVARSAIERRAQWLGDDPARLRGRPFDSLNKLGLDEPSDYDTNVSNDLMVEKARAWWEANGRQGSFVSGAHEYVDKEVAQEVFPNLRDWADAWSERLGRDVSWAVFPGAGPKNVSASGHFVHFQDDDWIVHRPEGS